MWQWTNRIRMGHRADEIMKLDGIAPKVLPPGFLIPLLDAAGNVDDPELQQMWAQLLASSVSNTSHRHPAFVHVLRELSRDEAVILNSPSPRQFIINEGQTPDLPNPMTLPGKKPQVAHWVNVPMIMKILRDRLSPNDLALAQEINAESVLFCANHLEALGLVVAREWHAFPNPPTVPERILALDDSEFGSKFVEACCRRLPAARDSASVAAQRRRPRSSKSWAILVNSCRIHADDLCALRHPRIMTVYSNRCYTVIGSLMGSGALPVTV